MSERRFHWRRVAKVLGIAFIALAGVSIAIAYVAYKEIVANLCGVTVYRVTPAPRAKLKLVTFDIDCGATTRFGTHVSMVPLDAKFSHEKYPPFFSSYGQHYDAANWTNDGRIEVTVPLGEEIFRRKPSVNGIAVIYK